MSILIVNLTAGQNYTLSGGNYFNLLSQSGSKGVDCRFEKDGTPLQDSAVGAYAGFWVRPKMRDDSGYGDSLAFDKVVLTSKETQSLEVVILEGHGGQAGQIARVSGDVQTRDSIQMSLNGAAFSAHVGTSGSDYKAVQIFNPVSSGKRLVITSAGCYGASSTVYSCIYALESSARGSIVVQNASYRTGIIVGKNGLGSGGGSVAELREDGMVSYLIPADAEPVARYPYRHDLILDYRPKERVIVNEGEGFTAFAGSIQVTNFNLEWYEESI